MKKAIVENDIKIICPHCGENRSLMILISSPGFYRGWSVDYAVPGDTVSCVSCKKEFER